MTAHLTCPTMSLLFTSTLTLSPNKLTLNRINPIPHLLWREESFQINISLTSKSSQGSIKLVQDKASSTVSTITEYSRILGKVSISTWLTYKRTTALRWRMKRKRKRSTNNQGPRQSPMLNISLSPYPNPPQSQLYPTSPPTSLSNTLTNQMNLLKINCWFQMSHAWPHPRCMLFSTMTMLSILLVFRERLFTLILG